MPSKKTSIKKKGVFTEENLNFAIHQVQEKKSSMRQAALDFGIPKTTLSRYLKDAASDPSHAGAQFSAKKSMVTMQVGCSLVI